MSTPLKTSLSVITLAILLGACGNDSKPTASPATDTASPAVGQSAVQDKDSKPDIPKIAVGSKDHTTLVAALKAAEYLDVVSNAGPFTVFAPTNAAFGKLPAGTVETLVKPENKEKLRNILEYHVAVSTFKPEMLRDGMSLNMANGDNVKISNKDGKIMVNDSATIVATVSASNGIVHIIDGVLLPPAAK
jgi:uncharacterized surface protein with fasciclin (FAS1) repeats